MIRLLAQARLRVRRDENSALRKASRRIVAHRPRLEPDRSTPQRERLAGIPPSMSLEGPDRPTIGRTRSSRDPDRRRAPRVKLQTQPRRPETVKRPRTPPAVHKAAAVAHGVHSECGDVRTGRSTLRTLLRLEDCGIDQFCRSRAVLGSAQQLAFSRMRRQARYVIDQHIGHPTS